MKGTCASLNTLAGFSSASLTSLCINRFPWIIGSVKKFKRKYFSQDTRLKSYFFLDFHGVLVRFGTLHLICQYRWNCKDIGNLVPKMISNGVISRQKLFHPKFFWNVKGIFLSGCSRGRGCEYGQNIYPWRSSSTLLLCYRAPVIVVFIVMNNYLVIT